MPKDLLGIEDFHALLTSDKGGSSLLAVLRELTAIEKAEEIVAAVVEDFRAWL